MIQWLAKYRGDFHQWWKSKGLLVRDLVFQVEVVTVLGPGSRGQINRSGRGSSGGSCKRKREHFQERDDRRNDVFFQYRSPNSRGNYHFTSGIDVLGVGIIATLQQPTIRHSRMRQQWMAGNRGCWTTDGRLTKVKV